MDQPCGYLTIAAWPPGWNAAEKVLALVESAGIAPTDAERRCVGGVPLVVARIPLVAARSAEAVLLAKGVDAFALDAAIFAKVGPPRRARRLIALSESSPVKYRVELWRGEPIELNTASVWLIVRAKLRKTTLGEVQADAQLVPDPYTGDYHVETGTTRKKVININDLIDVYLRDGSRVRIDSSKFNFAAVQGPRSMADASNTDRLALQLATEAPGAIVDTGFDALVGASVVRPRDIPRSALERQRFPNDDPAFEFYSVWSAARYRRMLTAQGNSGGRRETGGP